MKKKKKKKYEEENANEECKIMGKESAGSLAIVEFGAMDFVSLQHATPKVLQLLSTESLAYYVRSEDTPAAPNTNFELIQISSFGIPSSLQGMAC
ncbi:hypothetical protein BPOR_0141g00190 [Botrytis porri]|uniref:Uncharacterized protein n=1 Tax=Botrytis porri TaxID=87229 RepID=A0A4Z1KW94_9HELO|nr:hypothetical protein BPOR_0141g00190 [Botrytis porri]